MGPSRPGLTIVARLDANACKNKPQSVGELVNSHDHTALGEIWALAGGGGANTKIAAATALARNSFIGTPGRGWLRGRCPGSSELSTAHQSGS